MAGGTQDAFRSARLVLDTGSSPELSDESGSALPFCRCMIVSSMDVKSRMDNKAGPLDRRRLLQLCRLQIGDHEIAANGFSPLSCALSIMSGPLPFQPFRCPLPASAWLLALPLALLLPFALPLPLPLI